MNYPKEAEKKRGQAVRKNRRMKAAILMIVVFLALAVTCTKVEHQPIYRPEYRSVNLESIISKPKEQLSEEDYKILFQQTGLGKTAVDYVYDNEKNLKKKFEKTQKIFFDGYHYSCVKIGMFTYNERMRDESGKKIKGYSLVDLKQGDVLISLSTHTLGYRHGHCGIIVNTPKQGKEAKTVEAIYWGEATEYASTGKWRYCPTFIHLRISEEAAKAKGYTQEEVGRLLAQCAEEECIGVQYGLLPGVFNLKSDSIKRTHCSHLVWYVFSRLGFDIDSDGGFIVSPYDIAASDLFEIVQIYGIDPEF